MILLSLTWLACSDYGFGHSKDVLGDDPRPIIEVDPQRLDFWSLGSDEIAVLSFTVRNVGDALLQVEEIPVTGSGAFALVEAAPAFDLAPGASREIEVIFTPIEPAEQVAEAMVISDDPDRPALPVELVGEGRLPYLLIDPDPHDFGALPLACGDAVEITLQNVGTEGLTLSGIDYEGDGQLTLRDPGALPLTLPIYGWTTVWVDFLPLSEGAAEGRLLVTSDDPRGVVDALQTGSGAGGDSITESFTAEDDPPVDVLFAVDRSCSMEDDAEALAENFAAFIDAVGAVTDGWQIGVVTQDDGCFNQGVLNASSPELEARFTAAVSEGDDREITDDEALFQLVDRALDQSGAGGCNEGFLRSGAPLHAIAVSDEPERSEEQAAAWTWEFWLDRLSTYGDAGFLFSGVVDSEGCNEGDAGYAEMIAATGGERLSLCSGDWAEHVAALASATTGGLYRFALSGDPVEGTVAVTVDGEPAEGGWTYDPDTNAVIFESLPQGAEVEITYAVASECP